LWASGQGLEGILDRVGDLDRWRDAEPTYPEVGATAATLPGGYRHVRRVETLGTGADTFEVVSTAVMSWQMHRGAGLEVIAASPVAETGAVVLTRFSLGPVRFNVPCRVVYVVDEPRARGFAYGTLPGHPEIGEESFLVQHHDDDRVTLRITAFSRPGRWFTRLGGPVARRVQDYVTGRYVQALRAQLD
jgi:uncharacterized protein (UPF0548 family)